MSINAQSREDAGDARTDHGPRVDAWERRSEWLLAALAVLFLGCYAWPILATGISDGWKRACSIASLVIWVLFAVDFAVRVVLARRRLAYVGHRIPDLLIIALPMMRPLRLLRLLLLLRVLNRRAASRLRGQVAAYVAGATVMLIAIAALAALDAERGAEGANIDGYGDALWWAMTTVSTVGYGDRYPVSGQGRLVAAGLMLGGIALIGVVTATLASWLIDKVKAAEEQSAQLTRDDLAAVLEQLQRVESRLEQLTGAAVAPGSTAVGSGHIAQ